MKKNLFYTFIILALVFGFSFFVGTQKTEAAPSLNIERVNSQQTDKGPEKNNWYWVFNVTTTGVADNTQVDMNIYTGKNPSDISAKNLIYSKAVSTIKNNQAEANTGPILYDNTDYIVSITIKSNPVVFGTYQNKTGVTSGGVVLIAPTKEGDGNKSGDGSDTYTLLAPLGNLKTAPKNIGDYFNIIFNLAIGLCAVLAVVMIVIGGVQYMGDESIFGKTEAKSKIFSAILGLIIALGSYALLNTINPDLLGKKGLKIETVMAEIEDETETDAWTGYSSGGDTKLCPEGFTDVTAPNKTKINVCKSISKNMQDLLNKATTEKILLSGSGTRSTAEQQALRIKHGCADKNLPSSSCKPPTARPGRSMHEAGKAIDFKCDGLKIASKDNACYVWLKKNAGFLKNLKSEPWHWSTDGR